ncbi:peptidylprolyl isomerase [Desulfofalx alkaliphila]|uniref:peptidylprolyl isomerase n=1 Tax=Desulfofalx alkaliphila TaxID=105483 RepID=UPI0004E1E220|nr:peptidylprolyl isomerase [Desulfofalx alkaliphila]
MAKKKKQDPVIDIKDPKTRIYLIIGGVVLVLLSIMIGIAAVSSDTGDTDQAANQPQTTDSQALENTRQVTINTDMGDIIMEVYPDAMPITVGNFEKLIQEGFYDGLTFHRVEDWVVQGGDPNGDGSGGPGWSIELETHPELNNRRGMVAMARSQDPNSAGSQFYILKEDAPGLDGDYAVFGKVIDGMDIVDQIEIGAKMNSVTID